MHRLTFALATAAMLTLAGATPTGAEVPADFPTRPVTLVAPTVPSVTGDLLMRAFAEVASRHLGQSIIVENKPGGSATLAAAHVAGNAKPDGYTITQIVIPVFRVPVMQKATYDPVKDFTYIIMLGGYTLGAVVKADSPFKSWQDVMAFAETQ